MFPARTPGHLRYVGSVDGSRVCDSAANECGLRRLGGGQAMFEKVCSGWMCELWRSPRLAGGSDKTLAFHPVLHFHGLWPSIRYTGQTDLKDVVDRVSV